MTLRVDRLLARLPQWELDGLLISAPQNRRYLSGSTVNTISGHRMSHDPGPIRGLSWTARPMPWRLVRVKPG